jgi:hypothetical protein
LAMESQRRRTTTEPTTWTTMPSTSTSITSTTLPSHCVPETATKLQQGASALIQRACNSIRSEFANIKERIIYHRPTSSRRPSSSRSQEILLSVIRPYFKRLLRLPVHDLGNEGVCDTFILFCKILEKERASAIACPLDTRV